jgi:putative SOS response-associated peptidase YedK
MCGRFTLHHHVEKIVRRFDIEDLAFPLESRYNIAPGEMVGSIAAGLGRNTLGAFKWGLIPSGSQEGSNPLINARIESLGQQKHFKESLEQRRCLIPVDGFYEWKGRKSPFYFQRRDRDLFAFAGIWDEWKRPDDPLGVTVRRLTILTTEANDLVNPIHDRMPVIVPQENERLWLDPSIKSPADLRQLVEFKWGNLFERYPVSMLVNRAGSDSPEMIREVEPEMTLFGLV